ncbi:pectate lyase-like adhesive domain-containing protein [Holzapfeliella sp. JNUCC 80]
MKKQMRNNKKLVGIVSVALCSVALTTGFLTHTGVNTGQTVLADEQQPTDDSVKNVSTAQDLYDALNSTSVTHINIENDIDMSSLPSLSSKSITSHDINLNGNGKTIDFGNITLTMGSESQATVTFDNVNLYGTNYYGPINSKSNTGILKFKNVTYQGPQPIYWKNGEVQIDGHVKINSQKRNNTGNDPQENMEVGKLTFLPDSTYEGTTTSGVYVFNMSAPENIVVGENANVTLNTASGSQPISGTSNVEMKSGSNLTINPKTLVTTTNPISMNNASFNINTSGNLTSSLLTVSGPITASDNSQINVNAQNIGTSAYPIVNLGATVQLNNSQFSAMADSGSTNPQSSSPFNVVTGINNLKSDVSDNSQVTIQSKNNNNSNSNLTSGTFDSDSFNKDQFSWKIDSNKQDGIQAYSTYNNGKGVKYLQIALAPNRNLQLNDGVTVSRQQGAYNATFTVNPVENISDSDQATAHVIITNGLSQKVSMDRTISNLTIPNHSQTITLPQDYTPAKGDKITVSLDMSRNKATANQITRSKTLDTSDMRLLLPPSSQVVDPSIKPVSYDNGNTQVNFGLSGSHISETDSIVNYDVMVVSGGTTKVSLNNQTATGDLSNQTVTLNGYKPAVGDTIKVKTYVNEQSNSYNEKEYKLTRDDVRKLLPPKLSINNDLTLSRSGDTILTGFDLNTENTDDQDKADNVTVSVQKHNQNTPNQQQDKLEQTSKLNQDLSLKLDANYTPEVGDVITVSASLDGVDGSIVTKTKKLTQADVDALKKSEGSTPSFQSGLVNYVKGYGVLLWQLTANGLEPTTQYRPANSYVPYYGDYQVVDGIKYLHIANQNTWIQAQYLQEPTQLPEIPMNSTVIAGNVPYGIYLRDGSGDMTEQIIQPETSWQVFAKKTFHGHTYYRLGNDKQWLEDTYIKSMN